jgi:AraC family transcriptional regulator
MTTLAFPLRGVFLKHHSRRERVVADACHAVCFNAGESYRVSHPLDGGDECLSIEPARDVLHDVIDAETFPRTYVQLDARHIAASRLLWHRIARRLASGLEVEETVLGLLALANGIGAPKPMLNARSRHMEMVEATKIALATRPEDAWSLSALATRVHSSPFRLARIFRSFAGMPVHRYHLRARMAAALDQVLDTSRDLTTIGLDLGFSSHSHFTAAFRRTFGVTPSVLRKEGKILTAA